jgi:hypothetical protein
VHDAANLVGLLLAKDPRRDIVRAQHVNDQRQLPFPGGADVRAKQCFLPVLIAGRPVEAGLADSDAVGRDELLDEVINLTGMELGHDLRMHAEREPHEIICFREHAKAGPRGRPDGGYENRFDARGPRTCNNFVAIAIEEVDVEVAMHIEHATAV